MIKELEKIENELRIESDKLKEVADVARNQVEMFESKAEIENIEMEAYRHQVIDLQTQTDEKVICFTHLLSNIDNQQIIPNRVLNQVRSRFYRYGFCRL